MNTKHRHAAILVVLVVAFALFMGWMQATLPLENWSLDNEPALQLTEGWYWEKADGTKSPVTLPTQVPATAGEQVTITCTLPQTLPQGATLLIRSSLASLQVEVDGVSIWERAVDLPDLPGVTVGSSWSTVRLPAESGGKTLTLRSASPYEDNAGVLNPVLCGPKASLVFYLFHTYGPLLLCTLMVFVTGVVMTVLAFAFRGRSVLESELFYLGLFSILVSLWFLGESKMLQLFTGSQYLVTNLAFFALLLMPLPFVEYLERAYQPHGRRLTGVLFWAFAVNAVGSVAVQALGWASLYQTIPVLHGLILLSSVLILASLLREYFFYKNTQIKMVLFSMLVLLVSCQGELISFYVRRMMQITYIFHGGMVLFILLLGVGSVRRLLRLVDEKRQAYYFKTLAYQDLLTGCRSRTAYYEDIAAAFVPGRPGGWLAILDVNEMKVINDRFGHLAGDEALKHTAHCMEQAFPEASRYRLGGDEFALILPRTDDVAFAAMVKNFYDVVKQEALCVPYPFQVALGFSWWDPARFHTFEALFHEVDDRMYQEKKRIKQQKKTAAETG